METERKNILETTLKSFIASSNDEKYITFLKSLSIEELEVYFYIEAQRSNVMIQNITFINGKQLNIDDLKNTENVNYLPKGYRFTEGIISIITFWDLYGKISMPLLQVRQSVKKKYCDFYKELSIEETDFFLNC